MKSTITRLFTILFIISSFSGFTQTSLHGFVTDAETGEPILYGNVSIYKDGVFLKEAVTDFDGKYSFIDIQPNTYYIEASYTGYTPQIQEGINVKQDSTHRLDFSISQGHILDEIIIESKTRPFPTKKIIAMATSVSGITSDTYGSSMVNTDTRSSVDGVRHTRSSKTESPLPASGQITAGEWNDLHNWKDWMTLLENEEYRIMTDRFEIYPTQRYSVIVINNEQAIIPNVSVKLLGNGGSIIWQTLTDNAGKAELWGQPFMNTEDENIYTITVDGKKIDNAKTIDQGSNTVILQKDCHSPTKMDIVFTVDATSSMSDEIHFLKSELLDVIDRIEEANEEIEYRTGSVFYRDTRDDYITRVSPLSENKENVIDFVMEQNASGGGDKPEAVEQALDETLKMDWDKDALKLVFLILDAPPHEDEATMIKIRAQIKDAASKGIKLIPITASGIGRETEFLMKFMAMMTNGTYVFITDDSGIGEVHLAPVVTDYDVEKLNDCMVRLITQYSTSYSCDNDYESINELEISIYPNPCTEYINIESKTIASKINILASNGMVVKTMIPSKKSTRIELDDLVNGVYTVVIYFDETILTKQVILLK